MSIEYIKPEEPIEEPQITEPEPQITEPEPSEPTKISIEGLGEFTADEIKEFKQGYLRQADYTKKTQELARQRKELEEQRSQPQLTQPSQSQYNDPYTQRLEQLESTLADQELNRTLTELKAKYDDFDEVKVLNEAYQRGVTDLEFVYKATKEDKPMDTQSLREQIKNELLAELQAGKQASTIAGSENNFAPKNEPQLSQRELEVARKMGLTPEDYIKYK